MKFRFRLVKLQGQHKIMQQVHKIFVASTEEQLASMEEIGSVAGTLSQMAEELQVLIEKFKI